MIDVKNIIDSIINRNCVPEKANMIDVSAFLIDNNWFGIVPSIVNKAVLIDDSQCEVLRKPLETFLTTPSSSTYLLNELHAHLSTTADLWKKFAKEEKLSDSAQLFVLDFLLYHLKKELPFHKDTEITELLKLATDDLTKAHGDLLTFFIAWVRSKVKTAYYRDYIMEKRYTLEEKNGAYSLDEYLALSYRIFNEDYIEENDMYVRAAASKDYTDTWLFLSMHFICSLRYTDLKRIYHPELPYSPEETIAKIKAGTFSVDDGLHVLLTITQQLAVLPLAPSKTEEKQGIGSIKLTIPASCERHFAILFALAEAHRQLAGVPDEPIIRRVTDYESICRYMGDEIGDLFLEANFRPRSATKSYLQSIFLLADDILEEAEEGPNIKGYMLAALARSHKGSYGEFASTTFTYLKDAKFSGLTPEFVAFELLERGVLSFSVSLLLKIITADAYSKLAVKQQTEMIKTLNLLPGTINKVVSLCEAAKSKAEIVVKEAIASDSDILALLHEIGSGAAYSKQANSMCLLTAMKKLCPYTDTRQCVGCEYEIATKSTFFLLISEYKRMLTIYNSVNDPLERKKYELLVTNILLPKLNEMLNCIGETYGEDIFRQYENYLKESIA